MTVAGLVLVSGLLLLTVLVYVVAGAMGIELQDPASDAFLISPAGMAVTNIGLALAIPIALAATWAQAGRAGLVSSVIGRVRWRLVLGGIGIALLLLVPLTLGSEILMTQLGLSGADAAGAGAGAEAAAGAAEDDSLWPLTPATSWLALTVVILLTTPLQAAGEEYFFRGWLSQWIGSWLRWRWLALVVPALVSGLLFALAHGAQSPWLFADRLVFGLVASLLVWRTGGLELAVALHAANNLLAFGFAIAYDGLEESLLVTEVTALEGGVSIGGTLVTAAVLLWWARGRRPVRVVTHPAVPLPVVARPAVAYPEPAYPAVPQAAGTQQVGVQQVGTQQGQGETV